MGESWEDARLDHRSRQAASIAEGARSLLAEHGAAGLTMAAIADRAAVSRQTLYRYFKDVDAVLVGIAELVTAHDDSFIRLVGEQPGPRAQLDFIARAATSEGHSQENAAELLALLPPAGRDIVAQHHARACALVGDVLQRGVADGSFRGDLRPAADAPLLLGLLGAADPSEPERAVALVHELVRSRPKEPT